MKYIFIIFSILLISCTSSSEVDESSYIYKNLDKEKNELVRTFKNDYSLWKNNDDSELYEDLKFNLGAFESFELLRQAQYRKMGIIGKKKLKIIAALIKEWGSLSLS